MTAATTRPITAPMQPVAVALPVDRPERRPAVTAVARVVVRIFRPVTRGSRARPRRRAPRSPASCRGRSCLASAVVVGAFSHARLVVVLTLVLTRHGMTARSVPEQHLGQRMDVPLSSTGLRQAHALARRLHDVGFDRIVTSPLVRARETAEIVAIGRPVIGDPRLTEMDYGEWEGHTYPEVRALHPGFRGKWESDPATLRCPGGESGNDVARRVGAFLRDVLDPGIQAGTAPRGRHDGRRRGGWAADPRRRAQHPRPDPALHRAGDPDPRLPPPVRGGPHRPQRHPLARRCGPGRRRAHPAQRHHAPAASWRDPLGLSEAAEGAARAAADRARSATRRLRADRASPLAAAA